MKTGASIAALKPSGRRGSLLHGQRGSALMVVLILATAAGILFGAVISYLDRQATIEKRSNLQLECTYAAEYALESAYQSLRTQLAKTDRPNIEETTTATNLSTAPTAVFGSDDGYTWKTYLTVPVINGAVTAEHTGTGPYRYLSVVELERSLPTMAAPVRLSVQREWIYTLRSVFEYAIFYDSNMELFPGADFVVGGRVHANGSIYTGTSATIKFSDAVTFVNDRYDHRHDLDPRGLGSFNKDKISYLGGEPFATDPVEPPYGSSTVNTEDSNHNNDGARELIEIPNAWQTDPSEDERLYNKAGLKVLVNTTVSNATSSSAIAVSANSRAFVTEDNTVIPADDALAQYLNTMLSTDSVQDYREGKSVKTTDLDVAKLTTGYKQGGLPAKIPSTAKWPKNGVPAALSEKDIDPSIRGRDLWNGVLYIADITNTKDDRKGVKIVNGQNLPDGSSSGTPTKGLTIVTENAAYIVGDYNTGGTPPVNSGSDLSAKNYAGSDSKIVQPAAVIADAVTVLSNKWEDDDYNNESKLSDRPPVNTTVNTALISGIVTTSSSAYSGGVENYIRLLENWSGKRLTYYGSIINLYASQQSKGLWQETGNYYNAPARNWYFDVQFRDPTRLPPGSPMVRLLQRGQWVQFADSRTDGS